MLTHISKNLKEVVKILIPNRIMMHRLPQHAGKSIVLTFDDGPDRVTTPQILKRLEEYKARAIFFVVGRMIEDAPDIFDMIISHGHIIGNHTYNHPNRIITSTHEYRKELFQCAEVIGSKNGEIPQLNRPPLGISLAILQVSISMKTKIILWSIEGGEWGTHKHDSTEKIITELKNNLKPRDILLLHDNNQRTIQILDSILPFLKQKKIDLATGTSHLMS